MFGRRAMQQNSKVFVGLDTSKLKISVAVAEEGRQGEVRFLGEIDNTPETVRRLVHKLASRHGELLFCYEAGPTGYGLQRQIAALPSGYQGFRPGEFGSLGSTSVLIRLSSICS